MTKKFYYDHPALGRVLLTMRSDARSYVARWKPDGLHLTIPVGTSPERVREVLDSMGPRLIAKRPELKYVEGMTIEVDGLKITIGRQSLFPDKADLTGVSPSEARLAIGTALDFKSPATQKLITDGLKIIAGKHAPAILLPMAKEVAGELGVHPVKWSIGRGDRRLGCCNQKGEISLSRICVFLTPRLRRYVVCHELAHLSEMNHSERFHRLCNQYCGGEERKLETELRNYVWPILR